MERPSRTQEKAHAQALRALGLSLLKIPPTHLTQFELPEPLAEALATRRALPATKFGAIKRQEKRIGRLMQTLDEDTLRQRLARYHLDPSPSTAGRLWIRRLTEDENGITALVDAHPDVDHRQIRAALRAAAKTPEDAPEAHRKILAALHAARVFDPPPPG